MGIFNVSQVSLVELLPLSNFSGTVASTEYVVRAHTSGIISVPMSLDSPSALSTVVLDAGQYEILCAYPLKPLSRREGDTVKIANLGLLGRMTGCAAIVSNAIFQQDNGRFMVDTSSKAFGTLGKYNQLLALCVSLTMGAPVGLYISCLPEISIENDLMITIHNRPIPVYTVSRSEQSQEVLEVDFDRAWRDMELEAGWSNEIQLKISFAA